MGQASITQHEAPDKPFPPLPRGTGGEKSPEGI